MRGQSDWWLAGAIKAYPYSDGTLIETILYSGIEFDEV